MNHFTSVNTCFTRALIWSRTAPTAHHQVDGAGDFLGLRLVSLHAVPGKEEVVCLPSLVFFFFFSQHETPRPLLRKAGAPVIQQSLHESGDGGDE